MSNWGRGISAHKLKREAVAHWGGLTWGGDAVPVPRHVVVQGEEQHPHGQSEHARQETVENQVEQQDESWRDSEEQSGEMKVRRALA